MVAHTSTDRSYADYEELEQFEKIGRRSEWGMPSRRAVPVKRALRRTSGSRQAGRRVSARAGGKHQRRNRKFR